MSSYAVPPYVFEQKGDFDAPFTFTVPATLEVRPDTASAVFDGTGASGPFLACLTFYSPDGARLCRMFNPNPVASGDVAEVTFIPPFGSAASTSPSGGGDGFQYQAGTYGFPNVGDHYEIETTGSPGIPNDYQGEYSQTVSGSTSANLNLARFHATSTSANRDTQAINGTAENDGTNHLATAINGIAVQTGGGTAVGMFAQPIASGGGGGTAIGLAVFADGGLASWGVRSDAPYAFTNPADPTVRAFIFLRNDGGGVYSIVAQAGATQQVLVTG